MLMKKKSMDEESESKIQWIESYATLDVLWSGIPLGVITGIELYYFRKSSFSYYTEFVKMIALAIDLIGVTYLVYYEILGLEGKLFGHHHHHHHGNIQETQPLVKK